MLNTVDAASGLMKLAKEMEVPIQQQQLQQLQGELRQQQESLLASMPSEEGDAV